MTNGLLAVPHKPKPVIQNLKGSAHRLILLNRKARENHCKHANHTICFLNLNPYSPSRGRERDWEGDCAGVSVDCRSLLKQLTLGERAVPPWLRDKQWKLHLADVSRPFCLVWGKKGQPYVDSMTFWKTNSSHGWMIDLFFIAPTRSQGIGIVSCGVITCHTWRCGMADKVFLIDQMLSEVEVNFLIPPFKRTTRFSIPRAWSD